jgi:hypothetical protein
MRRSTYQHISNSIVFFFIAVFASACGGQMPAQEPEPSGEAVDAEDASFTAGGKSDWAVPVEGSAEADAVLAVVNTADFNTLDASPPAGVGLHEISAQSLIDQRNGPDAQAGTADDQTFGSLAELDTVPYIGLHALTQLVDYARANGLVADDPGAPAALEVVGDQVTTGIEGKVNLARVDDGVIVQYNVSATRFRSEYAGWFHVNPDTLETVGEPRPLGTTYGGDINRMHVLEGADEIFFAYGSRNSRHACKVQSVVSDDLSRYTLRNFVHACDPVLFSTDGHSLAVVRKEPGKFSGEKLLFETILGTDDEVDSSKALISHYEDSTQVSAVAMNFSAALDRYVLLYSESSGDDYTVYSTLLKTTRNFGQPDVDPVLLHDSAADNDAFAVGSAELVRDGEGFGFFATQQYALSMRRLDAAGQPVSEANVLVSDVLSYDVIRHQDHYIVVTKAKSNSRAHAHFISLEGELISSVQLSEEPVDHPAIVAVDDGYVAAWTDPNDKVNLVRLALTD